MTLQASGPISFSNINTELGNTSSALLSASTIKTSMLAKNASLSNAILQSVCRFGGKEYVATRTATGAVRVISPILNSTYPVCTFQNLSNTYVGACDTFIAATTYGNQNFKTSTDGITWSTNSGASVSYKLNPYARQIFKVDSNKIGVVFGSSAPFNIMVGNFSAWDYTVQMPDCTSAASNATGTIAAVGYNGSKESIIIRRPVDTGWMTATPVNYLVDSKALPLYCVAWDPVDNLFIAAGSGPYIVKINPATLQYTTITITGKQTTDSITYVARVGSYYAISSGPTYTLETISVSSLAKVSAYSGINVTSMMSDGFGMLTVTGATDVSGIYKFNNMASIDTPQIVPNISIPLSKLYGVANYFSVLLTGSQYNIDAATVGTANGWNGTDKLRLIVDTQITSTSTATPALTISGSFPKGVEVEITSSGLIEGKGGSGGAGRSIASNWSITGGSAGSPGGTAISASVPVSIINNGLIYGGGGGGGGGLSSVQSFSGAILGSPGGGGGGGGSGNAAGAGGAGGTTSGSGISQYTTQQAAAGNTGWPNFGGLGAYSTYGGKWLRGGEGGSGGRSASSGQAGSMILQTSEGTLDGSSYTTQLAGGSGGKAVVGNVNITWIVTGTRMGAIE